MIEVWKDIPGYEGLYQVSNLGKEISLVCKGIYKQAGGYRWEYDR